ncbi:hypothetical protein [Burkholderia cenocepacia]|uniref:hypothetical protein n=1 Tax=Burkholderia cenocepacia TaxID=95486 RepID=UPI0019083BE5|nr:hypothetical protein [Burkholderia cenocepacia]MBJ9697682.1 hypothetical protein [Burkholderia cenocepacia]MCA8251442.1 hypothetical protein [Burkholderia multivorans]
MPIDIDRAQPRDAPESQTLEFHNYGPKLIEQSAVEAHTYEFHNTPRCDTNFNNIEEAKRETFFAAKLIKEPQEVWDTVQDLSKRLFDIISLSGSAEGAGRMFREFLEGDTGKDGQFGRILGGIDEINRILLDDKIESIAFVKKMLLIKSFGAYIIDKSPQKSSDSNFIFKNAGGVNVDSLIDKFKPNHLFFTRGRIDSEKRERRDDIGILDISTFKSLDGDDRSRLLISGLEKTRPIFRTLTHVKENGKLVEAPFVNRTFDKNRPLIGAISGSTSCIMVGSNVLHPDMDDEGRKALAKSSVAFLVGGGYHSATEVLDVAYPGLKIY